MNRHLFLFFGLSLAITARQLNAQSSLPAPHLGIRVACIGASITAGLGTKDPAKENYAVQMQVLLGPAYDTRNFGVSGCTMLRKGDRSYWSVPAYQEALAFNPNVVVIDLGGNDSKAINWKYKAEFAADTRAMIESFRALPSHPRVLLCLPMPSFKPPSPWINDDIILKEQIPIMRQVAFETGTEIVDLHRLFIDKKSWFADGVHPNSEGAALMAKAIGGVISAQP
jgi:lysophospholipase L1-like esterase